MKPLAELDHYEVLEVSPDAAPDEIERAWRLARNTYGEASLAVYSIYDDAEAGEIRARIDEAWRVLSEPESRRAYDAELPEAVSAVERPMEISLVFEDAEQALPEPELEALGLEAIPEDDPTLPFDGSRLRRSRLHRGLDIEEIARVTKINPTYLRFIEDERFDDLPAPVYVRGFLCAYARIVGLDAEQVAASYMERFNGSREPALRGRGARG